VRLVVPELVIPPLLVNATPVMYAAPVIVVTEDEVNPPEAVTASVAVTVPSVVRAPVIHVTPLEVSPPDAVAAPVIAVVPSK